VTYSGPFIRGAAFLGFCFIRLYASTLKTRFFFHPDLSKFDRTRALYAFWHGRQMLLVPHFGRWHSSIMSDVSWAGEIQTHILRRMGYHVVRGSSKRQGALALIRTKRALAEGYSAAIALDGPRGPVYRSKPGILFLAAKVGYPVVPLTYAAEKAWILKRTWCRYMIPKPFSRCLVAMGAPVHLSAGEIDTEWIDRILLKWMKRVDRVFQ